MYHHVSFPTNDNLQKHPNSKIPADFSGQKPLFQADSLLPNPKTPLRSASALAFGENSMLRRRRLGELRPLRRIAKGMGIGLPCSSWRFAKRKIQSFWLFFFQSLFFFGDSCAFLGCLVSQSFLICCFGLFGDAFRREKGPAYNHSATPVAHLSHPWLRWYQTCRRSKWSQVVWYLLPGDSKYFFVGIGLQTKHVLVDQSGASCHFENG